MAIRVKVPRLSENADEATVTAWFAREGDPIVKGRPLVELTTDKAAFEIEAPANGHLLRIYAKEKSIVPTGFVLGVIGQPGERVPEIEPANARLTASGEGRAGVAGGVSSRAPASDAVSRGTNVTSPLRATPAARRLARELGVDLAELARQAQGGVITESMVREWKRKH